MRALVYRNTKSTIPNWGSIHLKQPRGLAYETDHHFVHMYGTADQLWTISNGLTVTNGKSGTLAEWVKETFGAENIEESDLEVGSTIESVWRPGLYYNNDVLQGLSQTNVDLRLSEQTLLLLVQRLDELLLFVEPTAHSLSTFSHKARELLILASTAVESSWKHYLKSVGTPPQNQAYTTRDYVRLCGPLHLSEFEVSLPRYVDVPTLKPFYDWSAAAPTQSLPWYDAYNKTKHDAKDHFPAATLQSCIEAIAANIVMFSVRFGPFRLYQGGGMLSALFNPMFEIALANCDPKSFYIPKADVSARNTGLTWGHADILPRLPEPLAL